MGHEELGGNYRNFHFKFVEPHEHDIVVNILENYLYLEANAPVGYKPEHADDWNRLFSDILKRNDPNTSYIAVDSETGEIAAVRIVDIVRKKGDREVLEVPPQFRHQASIDSFKCCVEACKDMDLFKLYGISEYPEMFGLCVVKKYREQGLATEMYRRGIDLYKKRGYKVVKVGFISPYTRRAGQKLGYKELARLRFHDCRDSKGNIMNPKSDPQGYLCWGIFDLRN